VTGAAASARLELCVCVLHVPREPLARALAELGPLELSADDEGRAPICIELWDVREGRIRFAGLPQERLYETGAMLMGSAYGALLGPLGSLSMGLAGRSLGAALSSAASRTLGRYRELLIGVPNVTLAGAASCYFVLGMRTDSPFAITVDRLLGYGFDKRAASFAGTLAGGLSVREASRQPELLHARIDEAVSTMGESSFAPVRAWLERPLLAGTRGRLAFSTLRRAYPAGAISADRATLQLGALHPALPPVAHAAEIFRVRDVAVELSLPSPATSPELARHG
jgi:hypothetical protein